jgi:hypothetical protein
VNVEAFVEWTCGPAPGGGALEAARFVLQVWNSDVDWTAFARELGIECGNALVPFNVVRAMGRWDHRAHRGDARVAARTVLPVRLRSLEIPLFREHLVEQEPG